MSIRKFLRSVFRSALQRGQVMVLYALLIPLLFLFVGVGMDLGWYYLNVSRLQNAADAAALAGAQALADKTSDRAFWDNDQERRYYAVSLVRKTPYDLEKGVLNYELIDKDKLNFENLSNYTTSKTENDALKEKLRTTMIAGRDYAEEYTRKNLSDYTAVTSPDTSTRKFTATDGWSISSKEEDKKVEGWCNLYVKKIDVENNVLGDMYYQVVLNEKIRHFFLPGWFDPMDAKVVAVVLLEPHDEDLLTRMRILEDTTVIKNWEVQNYGYVIAKNAPYKERWNHFQRADQKIYYTDGDVVRREDIQVKAGGTKGTARKTGANGNKIYDDEDLDSINIDYKQDVDLKTTGFTKDWDLGAPWPVKDIGLTGHQSGWDKNKAFDLRIHSNVDFDDPWKTRSAYRASGKPDVLWCRIESDPYYWDLGETVNKKMTQLNSVRQIFLNFNKTNTDKYPEGSTEGVPGSFINRPLCIFYDGPEQLDKNNTVRVSQPLVLNFNTDYNAIIFAPNSPVVINGNDHIFTGFVIAKEFVMATEESDYKKFETTDAYFQMSDLNLVAKGEELPKNAEAVSIDYLSDDLDYYVQYASSITSIDKGADMPENAIPVTFEDADKNKQYYIELEDLKFIDKKSNLPNGTFKVELSENVNDKLTFYITEEDHYYKIVETSTLQCNTHAKQHENVFFVDWKGNLQTKALPDGSTRPTDGNEKPKDNNRIDDDSIEVVYYSSAFGFSPNSHYSYFEVPELKRSIYEYLNKQPDDDIVDMFYTTRRASWID